MLIKLYSFQITDKIIAIDLSKQEKLDADPKTIQRINFTGKWGKNAIIFFIIEEVKETHFSKGSAL